MGLLSDRQNRGLVIARNGAVAASQPLAVSVGLNALMRGGSFADTAITTAAVLCVTEPYASHLGGDAFLVVYDAKTKQTVALNGSCAAPRAERGSRNGDSGVLEIESRVPESVVSKVRRRGHNVTLLPPWGHSSAYQLIAVDLESGAYVAGSDPRCDGHAAGF